MEKSSNMYISMHTAIGMIATVMRQCWAGKREVVGQGSFALPTACHLSTVSSVCEEAASGHSYTDIRTPVACSLRLWPVAWVSAGCQEDHSPSFFSSGVSLVARPEVTGPDSRGALLPSPPREIVGMVLSPG